MPAAGNGLVLVGRDHHARQWRRQVTLQIGQDDLVVVAGGQQVERVRREADGSDLGRMRPEQLNNPSAADVVEDAGRVFVAGHQEAPGRVNGARSDGGTEND